MLLPFVHGIDAPALSCALAFAQERDASLLLVSLVPSRNGSKKRVVRAESIAQAYDFFELMNHKAIRAGVPIKQTHISTQQVARSVQALAQEMACTGILLFVRNGAGVLLETEDVKRLIEQPVKPIYLFRLTAPKGWFVQISATLMHWLQSFFAVV